MHRTAETFRNGWVHTGDEVFFNDRKEIFVVDRIKVLTISLSFPALPFPLHTALLITHTAKHTRS